MRTLNSRQKDILRAVVEEYIRSAGPVGSRTLSRMAGFGVSPATIRNEMADLESEGLIAQTHLSSGRVPTEHGLRYYVDHLLDVERLKAEEEAQLSEMKRSALEQRTLLQTVLLEFSRALSQITHYPGLLLLADSRPAGYRKVQLLRIDESTLLVTLVSAAGSVSNRMIPVETRAGQEALNALAQRFNDGKRAFAAEELRAALEALLGRPIPELPVADEGLYNDVLFIEGVRTLFDHKEFTDSPERLVRMLELLETKSRLAGILTEILRREGGGPQVRIGRELAGLESLELSVVGAAVAHEGRPLGTLGLIGPLRMEYGRVLGLLELMVRTISEMSPDASRGGRPPGTPATGANADGTDTTGKRDRI